MHYYKRNLGDYAKKAGRLNMLQHGAYTLLIDACYDREQFPTRDEAIEWAWATTQEEIAAVDFVLARFFTLKGDVYVQTRIEEELCAFHAQSQKNREIAIEREAKRAAKRTNRARSVNESLPEKHEPPPNHKPLTINQEPKSRERAKGKRLDVEQLPDDWREFCSTQASHLDPLETFNRFRDYWIAQPGQKGVKVDWMATWRNWCRNEKPPNSQAVRPMTENQKSTEIYLRQRYPERYQQERKDAIEMD